MSGLWQARAQCYTALIWWISLRYFTVGFECFLESDASAFYRGSFAQISPQFVGVWITATGAIGMVSQIFSWRAKLMSVKLVPLFSVGVSLHSLFRITVLWQNGLYFDPLFALFVCDFGATLLILIGIPHNRKILAC